MTDDIKGPDSNEAPGSSEDEVEAHRYANTRSDDQAGDTEAGPDAAGRNDDDEVEAHRYAINRSDGEDEPNQPIE